MNAQNQSAIIAFLATPKAFSDGTVKVGRTTTHISEIFIGKDRVFKLKRAVKYPYLDFSTQEARKKYCEAEVKINRRTAPDMYLGVRPITHDLGGYSIGGNGDIVDWVVEMTRFDEDTLFLHMANAGTLDRHLMELLADKIAIFHAHAEAYQDGGGRAGVALTIEGNAMAFAENGGGIVDQEKISELTDLQHAELSDIANFLSFRRRSGCVRLCHGDIHLGNIFQDQSGEPVLFDGIEFNDTFATIDVLYDLSFLLMDLDYRGLGTLATVTLNRYLDITDAASGLSCLPLFMSLRAAIRSHVACAATHAIDDVVAKASKYQEAIDYLDLSKSYLDVMEPKLMAVGGLSGSGKSRLGRDLASHIGARPGARVVRSDVLRKRIAQVHPLDKLGPEGYTPEMTKKTYQAVFEEVRTALATGHSVIADCVFSKPHERAAIEAVADECEVPFVGFWLEASPEIMAARVTKRTKNASDADAEVVKMQLTYDLGDIHWHRIDSSGSRQQSDNQALKILGLDDTHKT